MAGEMEEPFRFNFQADLLHSGSISFGRFESESLSWERRSSFSHNRYLEEVEKYSKPGSVTEKKAYFEAHFRRKALLKQSSSECQDGREFRTTENEDPHDMEESESHNSSSHSKCDEETEVLKCENENLERLYAENGNESSHVTRFHESPNSLGYDEEGKIQEYEREKVGLLSVAPKDESMTNTIDHLVSGTEHFKLQETHQSGIQNVVLLKSEENLNDMVVMVDVASEEANDSSLTSHTADKDDDSANSGPRQIFSPMVRPASEIKRTRPKLKDHATVTRVQRTISSEASKASAKAKTKESGGLLMKEKQTNSHRPASPIIRSGRKTSISEELSTSFSKAKILPPKKSIVKEARFEKTVEAKSSLSGSRQNKQPINQGAAGFSFKSDERAERRKEEKKASEMTQFRKSLNFKATPMPSFYKESAPSSDRNKVISTTTSKAPKKPQTLSTASRTNKFSSKPRPTSSTSSSTNKTRPSLTPMKNHAPERRLQDKRPNTTSQIQKQNRTNKGTTGPWS